MSKAKPKTVLKPVTKGGLPGSEPCPKWTPTVAELDILRETERAGGVHRRPWHPAMSLLTLEKCLDWVEVDISNGGDAGVRSQFELMITERGREVLKQWATDGIRPEGYPEGYVPNWGDPDFVPPPPKKGLADAQDERSFHRWRTEGVFPAPEVDGRLTSFGDSVPLEILKRLLRERDDLTRAAAALRLAVTAAEAKYDQLLDRILSKLNRDADD